MVYLRCEKRVRIEEGKLRLNGVYRGEQLESQLKILITCLFQANLPGIFFDILKSARHKRPESSKAPGAINKRVWKKEDEHA